MATKSKGSNPYLERVLFQIVYDRGYRYLDRCGQTILDIMALDAQWMVSEANPQSGSLLHLDKNLECNFNAESLDVSMRDDRNLMDFVDSIAPIVRTVQQNIDFGDLFRVGLRFWYLVAMPDEGTGDRRLKQLNLVQVSSTLSDSFLYPLKSQNFAFKFESEDGRCGHRISLSNIRREQGRLPAHILKKNPRAMPAKQREALLSKLQEEARYRKDPRYAILCDMDHYKNEPELEELDTFVRDAVDRSVRFVRTVLS